YTTLETSAAGTAASGAGDCRSASMLLAGMARSQGLPARLGSGVVFRPGRRPLPRPLLARGLGYPLLGRLGRTRRPGGGGRGPPQAGRGGRQRARQPTAPPPAPRPGPVEAGGGFLPARCPRPQAPGRLLEAGQVPPPDPLGEAPPGGGPGGIPAGGDAG